MAQGTAICYIRTPTPTYHFFLAHEGRVQALGSFGHSGPIREEEAEDVGAILALAARILSGEFPEVRKVPLGEDVLRAWVFLLGEDEDAALSLAEAALEAAHRAKDLREAEAFLREALKELPAQEEEVA